MTKRGFASMNPALQRRLASLGGRRAHELGKAHRWTSEEAREAGRKGGIKVSKNTDHMSKIGTKGGRAKNQKSKDDNQFDLLD